MYGDCNATARGQQVTGRWLEEERATRNEAPTMRRGKEQSLRRLRRIYPKGAQFCFGELAPVPKPALAVRRVRDGAALADPLSAPNRVQAAAAGEARRGPMGRVVWPCNSSSPPASASFRPGRVRRLLAQERYGSPGTSIVRSSSSVTPPFRSSQRDKFQARFMAPCLVPRRAA
jgi:hypothetical protein